MGFRTSRPFRVALSLRMNSYKSPEKHNPTSNPSGDRDVYLLGRAKRRVKNVSKTSRRTSLGKRFFHMSGSEKRAMTQLDLVSTRIMTTVRSIISIGSLPPTPPLNLTLLSYDLCKITEKLSDLVKRASIPTLKAIHKFFHRLIEDEVVKKYFKGKGYNSLLFKGRPFMREFVGESKPKEQRKILLKKLKKTEFILPRLFLLYGYASVRVPSESKIIGVVSR